VTVIYHALIYRKRDKLHCKLVQGFKHSLL